MGKRIIGGVSLVLALLLVSPVAPAGAHRRTVLRRVTKVVGAERGWTPVRLPRAVNPTVEPRPGDSYRQFEFVGNGRVIAFALVKQSKRLPLGEAATLIGWSWGRCMTKGCAAKGFLISNTIATGRLKKEGDDWLLPAGRYRLYFLPDAARASIRFEFDELKGRTTLSPDRRFNSQISSLRPSTSTSATGDQVYWSGDSTSLEGRGLSLLGLWVEGDEEATSGEAGFCIYREAPPDESAYVPPCPAADDQTSTVMRSPNNEFSYYNNVFLDQGLGAHYTTPAPIERAGGLAVWIKYRVPRATHR